MTEGYGYIYCFSNPSMPGILKIGMTERTPETRLREANASDTWRPPTPYNIEFAKKVYNPSKKENTLHTLMEQYTDRIHPRREFFRISSEEVINFFDLMDGEMWIKNYEKKDCEIEDTEVEDDEIENTDNICFDTAPHVKTNPSIKRCRDMAKCFTNGQRIKHTIGITKTWEGIYNSSNNSIMYNGKTFTLNKFTENHYKAERPDRTPSNNAWSECKCEVNGVWISTYDLPTT
jgi:hypothetical protein